MKLRVLDIIIISTVIGGFLSTGIYFLVDHLMGSGVIEEDEKWTNKTIRQLSVGLYSSMISFADSLPSTTYKNLCVTWENVYCLVDCITRDYKYTPEYSQNKLPYSILKTIGNYNFPCMMNCIGVIGNWSPYFYYEVFVIESQYLPPNEDKCYMDYIQKEISPLHFIELLMGDQNFDLTYQNGLSNLMRGALISCNIIYEPLINQHFLINQTKDHSLLLKK